MFIKPRELRASIVAAGLRPQGRFEGIKPGADPITLIRLLHARRSGRMTIAEFGQRAEMRRSRDLSVLYGGYALAV